MSLNGIRQRLVLLGAVLLCVAIHYRFEVQRDITNYACLSQQLYPVKECYAWLQERDTLRHTRRGGADQI